MPHSYSNSDLFVHCVLKTRFVSSFVPGIVRGKPTPILRAAAVGTDIGLGTGKTVDGGTGTASTFEMEFFLNRDHFS